MDINKLTLEQKIGQMFLVAVPGTELSAESKAHLLQHNLGNYIFFTQNLTGYNNIRSFSDSLQQTAQEICGIPAFISVDQEGGMVARAYSGATIFPTNMAITASGMKPSVKKMGAMVAAELKSLGMNINHAPVVDVNNNPSNPIIGIRSYSDSSAVVTEMALEYIAGLQGGGVMANVKHFPGHGDTNMDSHLALPSIDHDMNRLNKIELAPFKAAIAGGVDSVMTAHIIFKAIDSERPATLSPNVLTDLLRKQLGFEGLVITDCMTMKAIDDHYGMAQGCVMAINAGADILCLCAKLPDQSNCYNTVLAAVKSGEISMQKIDAAVERILKYKAKYALDKNDKDMQPQPEYPAHEALADEISRKSLTLVKNDGNLLPLTSKNVFAISPSSARTSIADNFYVKREGFCQKAAEILGCGFAEITVNPKAEEIAGVVAQVQTAEIVLLATYNAITNPGQVELFNTLKAAGKKVIVVSLRVPYDILKMPNADAYIAAYEYTGRSVNNVIKAILGEIPFEGKLPVTL